MASLNEKHATEINAVLADLADTKKENQSSWQKVEDMKDKIRSQDDLLRQKEQEMVVCMRDLDKHIARVRELEADNEKLRKQVSELDREVTEARAMVSSRVDGTRS